MMTHNQKRLCPQWLAPGEADLKVLVTKLTNAWMHSMHPIPARLQATRILAPADGFFVGLLAGKIVQPPFGF